MLRVQRLQANHVLLVVGVAPLPWKAPQGPLHPISGRLEKLLPIIRKEILVQAHSRAAESRVQLEPAHVTEVSDQPSDRGASDRMLVWAAHVIATEK